MGARTATRQPRAASGVRLAQAVGLELAKTRRLRTAPVAFLLALATVALSAIPLFTASSRPGLTDASHQLWPQLLLSYALMATITGPVLASVLASRQTEIEHSGAGWTLYGASGVSAGALCRVKVLALAPVVAGTVCAQGLALVALALLKGVVVPFDPVPWVGYTVGLVAVDLVLTAFHVWLAAVKENQLIGVGVGLLGAFIGMYMQLAPSWLARMVPWGYYAMVGWARQHGTTSSQIRYEAPDLPWVVGFVALSALLFVVATGRLDRIER